jgi:amino acid transporter
MSIKIIFIVIFIFILVSLGTALFNLVFHKNKEHSEKTVKALSYRIGISLILFILLYFSYMTGMIKPEGIGARIQVLKQNQVQNKNQIKP